MKDSQKKKKSNSFFSNIYLPIANFSLTAQFFSKKKGKKGAKKSKKTFYFTFRSWHIFILLLIANILAFGVLAINYGAIQRTNLNRINFSPSVVSYPQVLKLGNIDASSQALAVYDTTSRVFVYTKNENFRFAPASTTKIVTALVALSHYTQDAVLVARNPDSILGSEMGLYDNEQMSVENLLYGLMLPSGNDAAYVLSSNYPGGTVAYVAEMNRVVDTLQLKNTRFFDPSGLSDENYTTAYDLARIAAYASGNQTLSEIVRTQYKTVFDTSGTIPHTLRNLNELLSIPGVIGMKTGYTDEAGGVLVTTVRHLDRTYVIVILKSEDRFGDTRQVIEKIIKQIQLLNY